MPKSNEVDDFLTQVSGDDKKDDNFVLDEKDPLSDKSEKIEDKSDEGSDEDKEEKPLPFHKDPKVLRFIEKEVSKRLADKSSDIENAPSKEDEEDELSNVLVELVGNDTPEKVAIVKKLQKQLTNLEEKGAQRAIAELRKQEQAELEAEEESFNQLVESFDAVEEEFGVDITSNSALARKQRSDFVDFIKKISPKDENGDIVQYPDIPEAFKLFQSTQKPADNKRAKDIADRSMKRSSDTSSAPTGGKTWKDIDRIFSKL